MELDFKTEPISARIYTLYNNFANKMRMLILVAFFGGKGSGEEKLSIYIRKPSIVQII
jgi:hypothetical protein